MKRYLTLVLLLFTLVAAGCTPASPTNSQPQKQQTQQQQPGETKQGQDTKSQTDTKETPVANLPTIGDTQADWEKRGKFLLHRIALCILRCDLQNHRIRAICPLSL